MQRKRERMKEEIGRGKEENKQEKATVDRKRRYVWERRREVGR